eukprot:490325-Hanusia_phi.AAC.1
MGRVLCALILSVIFLFNGIEGSREEVAGSKEAQVCRSQTCQGKNVRHGEVNAYERQEERANGESTTAQQISEVLKGLERAKEEAVAARRYEEAARLRDEIKRLKEAMAEEEATRAGRAEGNRGEPARATAAPAPAPASAP